MNSLFVLLGIESWKPVLTALLLPPVPLLLLMLVGARWMASRRRRGGALIATAVVLLWLTACVGTARWLSSALLHPPAALGAARIAQLKAGAADRSTAIVVLGGGVEPHAPEYGAVSLEPLALERLRYGIWLSRQTGLALAYSGGAGWAQPGATPEARIAARIAADEFGHPLRWTENGSRDTRENAVRSVALLAGDGIRHIVLVTHGWHMPRARRDFERAAGASMRIEAAPMGLGLGLDRPALDWLPSAKGTTEVRQILRELIGRAAGA